MDSLQLWGRIGSIRFSDPGTAQPTDHWSSEPAGKAFWGDTPSRNTIHRPGQDHHRPAQEPTKPNLLGIAERWTPLKTR